MTKNIEATYNCNDIVKYFHHENINLRKNFNVLISSGEGIAMDVPCGSGIRLKQLSEKYNYVFGYDLSENMVFFSKNLVRNLKNVEISIKDILSVRKVGVKVNDAFILEYAIHFFNLDEIKCIFLNFSDFCETVYLEVFDYNYVNSSILETFYFEGQSIILKKLYNLMDNKVLIKKEYYIDEDLKNSQNIILYNHPIEKILIILRLCKFEVIEIYSDYSKSVNKDSPRKILVCKNLRFSKY